MSKVAKLFLRPSAPLKDVVEASSELQFEAAPGCDCGNGKATMIAYPSCRRKIFG